jgi:hypothetical protein
MLQITEPQRCKRCDLFPEVTALTRRVGGTSHKTEIKCYNCNERAIGLSFGSLFESRDIAVKTWNNKSFNQPET